MDNPFERRATEQVRNEEAFLALISPEPVTTYLKKFGANGQLYDRLVIMLGTPGSGKTTMAKLFEYPMITALLRNTASQAHRALLTALTDCYGVHSATPTILAHRLPLESDYREIWEFPYSEGIREGLFKGLVQARAVLGWLSHLRKTGLDLAKVRLVTTGTSNAAVESIGGISGSAIFEKAVNVEREIYRVVGALLPPPPDTLSEAAIQVYRPFDVIDRFVVPYGSNSQMIEVRPLIILDDAHTLHPAQFHQLSRWLIRRELKVARWVLTRFDVLSPGEALRALLIGGSDETDLPGITTAREVTQITLQNTSNRREQRALFRKMAKDMANRYLSQMPEFSSRKLINFEALLLDKSDHLSAGKLKELFEKVESVRKKLGITTERKQKLLDEIDKYKSAGESVGEDEQLAMLAILMNRYVKRIPQASLFAENADPEPARPLGVDSSVFEAARLHLFHEYDRPYYFGIDDVCDASSENAEQFLRLAAILVEAIATRLIRGRIPSLPVKDQNRLLRDRAGDFLRDWNFPHCEQVRELTQWIAKRCIAVSLEPNAWIGAGANAFGVLQENFDRLEAQAPDLIPTIKYAVAYNGITLIPRYECKNKLWCLLELGGLPKLYHGLTLKRGGFVEGTLDELIAFNRTTS